MLARKFGEIKIAPNSEPPAAWFYIISREKHTSRDSRDDRDDVFAIAAKVVTAVTVVTLADNLR